MTNFILIMLVALLIVALIAVVSAFKHQEEQYKELTKRVAENNAKIRSELKYHPERIEYEFEGLLKDLII